MSPRISIVVAMDKNGLIGRDNQLPWHLPADLKLFKSITMGKPVIMGRKTFESIGRALPGRLNIVVTSNSEYVVAGCLIVPTLDDAIKAAGNVDEVMIIGGATLYKQALVKTHRIYLTLIEAEFEGDTWFPVIDAAEWLEGECIRYDADDKNNYAYAFKILDRKN